MLILKTFRALNYDNDFDSVLSLGLKLSSFLPVTTIYTAGVGEGFAFYSSLCWYSRKNEYESLMHILLHKIGGALNGITQGRMV